MPGFYIKSIANKNSSLHIKKSIAALIIKHDLLKSYCVFPIHLQLSQWNNTLIQ